MAPMSDLATGKRRIPARGNAQHNLAWPLKNLPYGTYYWSVQAIDTGYLGSGWSSEGTFSIVPPPGPFSLTAPVHGSVDVPTRPLFTWSASTGAASYHLQVATDAAFANLSVDQAAISGTSFRPGGALLSGTVYYWRVLAINAAGSTTATGAPASLTTNDAETLIINGGCGLLGLEVLILLALRRRFRSA